MISRTQHRYVEEVDKLAAYYQVSYKNDASYCQDIAKKLYEEYLDVLRISIGRSPKSKTLTSQMLPNNHFPAYLIADGEEKVVQNDICFIEKQRHIVVHGTGGLGKTVYLKDLYNRGMASGVFSYVLLLPLASMAEYGKNYPINTGVGESRFVNERTSYLFSFAATIGEWNDTKKHLIAWQNWRKIKMLSLFCCYLILKQRDFQAMAN